MLCVTAVFVTNVDIRCFCCCCCCCCCCCLRFQCRSFKAVAVNDNQRFEVVRFASSQSDKMFQKFRDDGLFVGADAFYVCFDHPDRALRGSLKLSPIIDRGAILDLQAFEYLVEDLLCRGLMLSDASTLQLLFAYKPSYQPEAMLYIIQALFERLSCHKCCLLSEAALLARCTSSVAQSCLVVDIGACDTRIYVCFFLTKIRD